MATATSASTNNQGSQGENTGRWTAEEHSLFLEGLELHGKGWKKIAGLIKSRTVVQIRTHAQKYFQKLAKAKQNGEDVGMSAGANGGNGHSSVLGPNGGVGGATNGGGTGNLSSQSSNNQAVKRRKRVSGTKRKAISSVVASVRREENKKKQAVQKKFDDSSGVNHKPSVAAVSTTRASYNRGSSVTNNDDFGGTDQTLIPFVAPALTPYVMPYDVTNLQASGVNNCGSQPSGTTDCDGIESHNHGAILEDSLFRYLTPTPIAPLDNAPVNQVARVAGANPITVPAPNTANNLAGGEISPTAVIDLDMYTSWTDPSKEPPEWYSKGSDVDTLLDVADNLDWLADTGDFNETYEEAERLDMMHSSQDSSLKHSSSIPSQANPFYACSINTATMSTNTLPLIDYGADVVVPPLPSLFDGDVTDDSNGIACMKVQSPVLSSSPSMTNLVSTNEPLFSSPIEESDFVSCIMNE